MGYEYTSARRAKDRWSLPNVEVFSVKAGEWWFDKHGERCDAPSTRECGVRWAGSEDAPCQGEMSPHKIKDGYTVQSEGCVTVFDDEWALVCDTCGATSEVEGEPCGAGFYYAYGFPGCLWDGEPMGPYDTYQAALDAAREDSGDEDEEEGKDEHERSE